MGWMSRREACRDSKRERAERATMAKEDKFANCHARQERLENRACRHLHKLSRKWHRCHDKLKAKEIQAAKRTAALLESARRNATRREKQKRQERWKWMHRPNLTMRDLLQGSPFFNVDGDQQAI